jgi:2,3-bisphosphoglycerate-dependent phosphoglycerate mutase
MKISGKLILVRHGQSQWNVDNIFTGWVDVPLTKKGRSEAVRAGELLTEHKIEPDLLFTSVLQRAIVTANIALESAGRSWIPVTRSWKLNERHYGALQGKNKKETLEKFGEEQFALWRRSFDTPPPAIEPGNQYDVSDDPQYEGVEVPRTECLKDVIERFLPYYDKEILPEVLAGKNVMVVAHGNSLRALVKHLENMSDTDIAHLNIPTGIPLVYDIDTQGKPVGQGIYLDPEAATEASAAVAQQGR